MEKNQIKQTSGMHPSTDPKHRVCTPLVSTSLSPRGPKETVTGRVRREEDLRQTCRKRWLKLHEKDTVAKRKPLYLER